MKRWLFVAAAIAVVAAALALYVLATGSPPAPAPSSSAPSLDRKPEAGSRKPDRDPEAGRRKPEAGSAVPRVVPATSPQTRASARAERDALLDGLRDSGSGKEPWDDQARALLGSLAAADIEVTWGGCFVAGCAATVVFPSRDVYDHALDDVARGSAFHAWTGGKKWSAPEVGDDGRLTAAIVLYRPD